MGIWSAQLSLIPKLCTAWASLCLHDMEIYFFVVHVDKKKISNNPRLHMDGDVNIFKNLMVYSMDVAKLW